LDDPNNISFDNPLGEDSFPEVEEDKSPSDPVDGGSTEDSGSKLPRVNSGDGAFEIEGDD
jgi:hypothetical protein